MPWKEDIEKEEGDDLLQGLYKEDSVSSKMKIASRKKAEFEQTHIPIQRAADFGFKDLGFGSFLHESGSRELKIASGSFWNVVEKDGKKYLQKAAERTPLTETVPELVENDVKTKYDQQAEQRELSVSEEADRSLVTEDLKKKGLASVVEAAKIEISDSIRSAVGSVMDYIASDAAEIGATSTKELVEMALDAGRLHDQNPAADQEVENLINEHGYDKVAKAIVKVMKGASKKVTAASFEEGDDVEDDGGARLRVIATGTFEEMVKYDKTGTAEDLAPEYRTGVFVACEDIDSGEQGLIFNANELQHIELAPEDMGL